MTRSYQIHIIFNIVKLMQAEMLLCCTNLPRKKICSDTNFMGDSNLPPSLTNRRNQCTAVLLSVTGLDTHTISLTA